MTMKLTMKEMNFCEFWLEKPSKIWEHLTRKQFTEQTLGKMIYYELKTRRRRHLLNRLVGRWYKLRRQRTWTEILKILEDKGEGISHRGLLSEKSAEYWRESL